MTATITSLSSQRRKHEPPCTCPCVPATGTVCYPHRLAALAARVEETRARVEPLRFADWSTFERLAEDVLAVLGEITDDCLPDERTAR